MDTVNTVLIFLVLVIFSAVISLFNYSIGFCRKSRLEKNTKLYKALRITIENHNKYSHACFFIISLFRISAVFTACTGIMRFLNAGQFKRYASILIIAASFLIMGIIISLLSDVLPKFLSQIKPEKTAVVLFPAAFIFYVIMFSFNWLILKIYSILHSVAKRKTTTDMTEDELRSALLEGEKSGIVESNERSMVEGVFYLGDRPVSAFMTHRSEIIWLDCNLPYQEILQKAVENREQECFPVTKGGPDEIIGTVDLEDIILDYHHSSPQGLRLIMKKAQYVPGTMSALKAFESFKQGDVKFLLVMDEYGGLAGTISITALLEEIVGDLSISAIEDKSLIRQEDGSMLAYGMMNIDDAIKALNLTGIEDERDFHTLAGFVLYLAGELPSIGDSVEYQGHNFKVLEMDGNRIDKLLIS